MTTENSREMCILCRRNCPNYDNGDCRLANPRMDCKDWGLFEYVPEREALTPLAAIQ